MGHLLIWLCLSQNCLELPENDTRSSLINQQLINAHQSKMYNQEEFEGRLLYNSAVKQTLSPAPTPL